MVCIGRVGVSPCYKALSQKWVNQTVIQVQQDIYIYLYIYLCNKLSKRSEIHKYSTRHCGDLNLGLCRTEAAKRSFFYRAVKHFNDLTSDTRSVNLVSIFKSLARRELLGK